MSTGDTTRARWHYWLVATDETGKQFLVYGASAAQGEEAARQRGLEMLSGIDFIIKRLPTSNLATASSLIKGGKLEKTRSLKKASQRLGHTKSINRIRRKRRTVDWP